MTWTCHCSTVRACLVHATAAQDHVHCSARSGAVGKGERVNLKQAAARLGIHYQTAYKLVRSGALVAVRVGGTYEISEAALERYLTERAAQRADHTTRPHPDLCAEARVPGDPRAYLLDRLVVNVENVARSTQGVFDTAVVGLAHLFGDAVLLALAGDDGEIRPALYHHRDPARRSALAEVIETTRLGLDPGAVQLVMTTGEELFVPHVPQDRLRAVTPPELVQYLDVIGVHSAIVVPVRHGGRVFGVVNMARDLPGNPYTREDLALVEEVARLVGVAIRRSERFRQGWKRRAELVEAMTAAVEAGQSVDDLAHLLGDGPMYEALFDAEGQIVAANAAGVAMKGSANEGSGSHDVVEETEQEEERALMRRLLVGELSYHDGERTVRNTRGEAVRLVAHRAVVRAPDASPSAVVMVAHPAISAQVPGGSSSEPEPSRVGP